MKRPRLAPIALGVGVGLIPRRWWRRWPPLPLPDREWIAFRMETAYGDRSARPSSEDIVDFLEWAGEMRTLRAMHHRRRGLTR